MKPYVPIFSKTPARITEPAVGASVCASGSHVWNGNMGTLMANAKKKPQKSHTFSGSEKSWAAASSVGTSKVRVPPAGTGAEEDNPKIARSMTTDPASVDRIHVRAA